MVQGLPRPVIGTQVMNEVTLFMSRKIGLPWPEINVLLGDVEEFCEIVPLTLEVHREAAKFV